MINYKKKFDMDQIKFIESMPVEISSKIKLKEFMDTQGVIYIKYRGNDNYTNGNKNV